MTIMLSPLSQHLGQWRRQTFIEKIILQRFMCSIVMLILWHHHITAYSRRSLYTNQVLRWLYFIYLSFFYTCIFRECINVQWNDRGRSGKFNFHSNKPSPFDLKAKKKRIYNRSQCKLYKKNKNLHKKQIWEIKRILLFLYLMKYDIFKKN